MDKKGLRNLIDSLASDIEFDYKGIHGAICPFSRTNISISYGDEEMDCNSIDEVMSIRFFAGQSLNDISTEIELY